MIYINIVMSVITTMFSWFMSVVNACGMWSYVIGIFILCLVSRFLLAPLFGQALSDNAASNYGRLKLKYQASKYRSRNPRQSLPPHKE